MFQMSQASHRPWGSFRKARMKEAAEAISSRERTPAKRVSKRDRFGGSGSCRGGPAVGRREARTQPTPAASATPRSTIGIKRVTPARRQRKARQDAMPRPRPLPAKKANARPAAESFRAGQKRNTSRMPVARGGRSEAMKRRVVTVFPPSDTE